MRISFLLFLIISITSCASSNKQIDQMEQDIYQIAKEDEVIGDKVPSWTLQSGIEKGRLKVVGYSEMSADKSPHFVKKAALMDAETSLLSDAPADFRILTQNALTGADIESSEFYQVQTKLQEVIGITGIKHGRSICRKIVRYGESKVSLVRGCWFEATASLVQLKRAYANTLALKYGQGKVNKFEQIMQNELDKINDNRRYHEKSNNQNASSSSSFSDNENQSSKRLPATSASNK